MADADPVTLGKINYYCREKFYRSMQNAAVEGLRKYGNDPVLKFFNAYSYVLEGRVQEGMRELELLKDKRDVNLCSIMALIQGHKLSRTVDREAVQELDAKLKEERKQAGEKGLYFAGLFLFHNNRIDKAREYIDRLLKMNNSSSEGLVIKGWIDLLSGRESYMKKAIKYFDEALSQDQNKDPDALFGKAKYFEMRRNYSGALELINQVVVSFPNFLPALIEKIKVQLALQDWDQVSETCQRALIVDSNCLEALRYQLLHIICRDGNYAEAASFLGELLETMDRAEPKNGQLYSDMASVFARVAGRNALVLQQTYYLAERAASLDGGNAEFVNELGYQLMLQGRNKDAMKCYRNAMKLDETSVSALTGIIRCQLLEDQLEDAAQQLEFLNEIQQSIGRTAELSYLSAILAKKRNKEPSAVISLLNEAIESHFEELKGTPLGVDYFVKINPDFLVQIINDYLSYAPQQPGQTGQPVHPVLKKCSQVLDPLTRSVPGLLEGVYLMGKVKYLAGDIDAAQSTLQHCLDQDSTFSDAHILMAQIHLNQGNFKMANQSLEVGLSYNFEVREHPIYHLIKARIAKKQGNYEEAVKTLQVAMGLPGIKSGRSSSAKKSKAKNMISVNDRVSVFLELADAHRQLGEQHEATKVMQDAINEFQGTPEEVRIAIANSEFSLNRGDIEGALQQLRNIGPDQPYFVQAREKMADIYLHHRKDKRLYAGCYRELAEKYPSPHTQLLLGDAYINIQEPEKAIEVYEGALKKNPKDGNLASKIGKALVKTHNYGKAMNYYEAALRSGGQSFLRYDLAELLLRLRQFEKAEKVLRQALDTDAGTDLESMMDQAKYMVLLSKVHHKTDRLDDSLLALTKAREMQARVLKRVQVEQPDAITAQKQLAASICSQMAEHSSAQRDYEKAIKFYKEALIYNESDGKLGLELAHLYLITEDLDSCQHQLMTLLKNDKENDAATVMMADLMFRKNDYDSAMFHFQQLLERKPDHYQAMSRLIDLMRRAGKLDEVPKFFQMAEEASTKTAYDSGYHYCKGLYEWYCGNPNNALKSFNKARRDVDLGQEALCNMIDICLNPDNDTIGGEVFESVDPDAGGAKAEGEQLAVRTAEKLLKELKPKPGDIRPRLLDNMMLIATKSKSNIEKALSSFMEVASTEKDHVGALYGMAAAYMVLKQTPRARNQLKRVAKNTWNMQDAEDLEKSWLLLADIYIQSGKFDIATDLLKRILQYNKSCCKAYEYMGFIMEKEQSYKDAARYYENAWKYGNKNNPNIGYKLAFNYLKARRFVDAIDICHLVLTGHPNYPKIKKDILDKSRANLRA